MQLDRRWTDDGSVVALYLEDDDGIRWRVHDTTFADFKHTRVELGDPNAQYRAFVRPGVKKFYMFKKSELHKPSLDHIERQFREAEYGPTSRFNPMSRTPDKGKERRL